MKTIWKQMKDIDKGVEEASKVNVYYAKEYSKEELDEILNDIFGEDKQPKIKTSNGRKTITEILYDNEK